MKREHQLIVFGQALKTQVDAASKLVQTEFLDPVKAWLMGMSAVDRRNGVEVLGLVKAYIQESRPKDETNAEKVEEDFQSVADQGMLTPADVAGLLKTGALVIGNPAAAAVFVSARLGTPLEGYTQRIPGGKNPALRLLTLDDAQFDGLATKLKTTVDIEAAIREAAKTTLGIPAATKGKVAIK